MSFFSSSTTPSFVVAANGAESSSSSDEETYTLREALDLFFEKLATTTTAAYKQRINDFIQWYGKEYSRMIDRRLKKKHLLRYFVHKRTTGTRQMRPVVVSIKSMCRHLFKLKMLKKDITIGIPDPKQLPAKNERKMNPDTVKAFFALANTKRNGSYWAMYALLTYAGLRIKVLSRLKCADIKKDEVQNDGAIVKSYKVHVRDGKGGKDRYCGLKREVGEKLYAYAQSLNSTYLFPGRKENRPMHSQSLSDRIKTMAKHESIGRPEISAHYFRHFMASNALHNVSERVSFNAALFTNHF
jgi:site-specific recombinase XerD